MSVFTIAKLIPNNQAHSIINEVCFSPDGKTFCATYEYNNEVRLYSARTNALLRTFKNPGAALNGPHGVLLTKKHLIVANKGTSPCQFCIFNLADDTGTPVFSYTTPYAHLAEGHSIALHGRCLVVTYCEGLGKEGAIVSYDYDDENGRIIGPMDKQERWFSAYGDVKGVSFNKAGDKVYVTFQSDLMPWGRKAIKRLKNLVSGGTRGGPSRNGIAVFSIDQRGRFSSKPLWKKIFRTHCRLENIHIQGNRALVTNPDGGCIQLYDLRKNRPFDSPPQVIGDNLVFPHGAKISPDGQQLLVSDNGIDTVDHQPLWTTFVSPRRDRLLIFKIQ